MYSASTLDPEKETLRERAFTNWLSRDLKQATVDFCKNVGLLPIYAETREDAKTRYLFWHPPQGASVHVRSGYTRAAFDQLQHRAEEIGTPLVTLHLSRGKEDLYSAVWLTPDSIVAAEKFLALYGITPAKKENG